MRKKTVTRVIPVLALSLACQGLGTAIPASAAETGGSKISISAERISAKSASGHGAELAADGDAGTYWQSIPSNGEGDDYKRMYDHNRYIDITLDGTYSLSQIKIFNKVDGSFNNYYVYASTDGENYNKIISKTSDTAADTDGDSFSVSGDAAYLRLNMAYNSNSFATNLAEIEVYGTKISDTVTQPGEIQVEDWEGSAWQQEWDKFESDPDYAEKKTLEEMSNLVGRVLGEEWKSGFRFEMRDSLKEGSDIFEVKDGADGAIVIRGNSGVAMASGFNYYLKNYVNVDYNPMYGSNVALKELKPVGGKVVKEAQFDLRYALNFCTYSYTMAFWNWDEYEEFLDWCAMNGINLVLDIVGQEEVLRQTLAEYHYTDEEIKDYISGPAYFAWFYMQNMYSSGGPLPNAWFEQRVELGRKMHDRMQTYGITPVIQGFAGQVPETFAQKNEGAVLTPIDSWSGYTRPSIIKTYLTDAEKAAGKVNYFSDVAETFYEKQKNVFGDVSDYYATDPFHEGGNTGGLDIASIFKTVQDEMLKSNSNAVWVMQHWQDGSKAEKMSQMDCSKVLALDLQTDMNPQYSVFENNGTPWIYCMLHNFGGRMGLDGEIPVIASDPVETLNHTKNMKGIGITPEALENSPVVYELLFETTWSKDPIDYRSWLEKYSERRAGGTSESLREAWDILLETAYADKGIYYQGAAETVINARPADSFNSASTWGHSNILYDKTELDRALLLLKENYEAFRESPAFQYDLADVAEQVLCNAAVEYHKMMVEAKNDGDLQKFTELSTQFLELIELSDQILSTTDEFMLGTWIEASRKMIVGADDWTKDLFEFNARSLVTTWGGERVGSLKDYSNRKWAGLTGDFYKARWEIWIRNRIAELKGEEKDAADAKAESNWFLWEYQWVNRKSDDEGGKYAFATEPSGADLGKLAEQAYEDFSYTNLAKNTGGTTEEKVNVAEGKTVTTASATKSGELANITDGNTGTEWIAEGAGPHTLTVDLEKVYEVSEIVLSIPQLAKQFPYTWTLEYFDADIEAWRVLEEYTEGKMESNVTVAEACTTDKIRITMATADLVNSPLTITDIVVYGKAGDEEYTNLAAGLTAKTNKTNTDSGYPLSNITDGNTKSFWKTGDWGNDAYPADVEVDLGQDSYVEKISLHFEKAGLPFIFYVTVTGGDGQEREVFSRYKDHDGILDSASYEIEVKDEIRKVTVHMTGITGKGESYAAGPAIAEIMAMGTASATNVLQGSINRTRAALAELNYDGYSGSYEAQAKESLENLLAEAENALAAGMDQKTAEAWAARVEEAVEDFYRNGVVYIDRDALLTAISDAEELMDKLDAYKLTDEKAALQAQAEAAREIYDTYRLQQTEIDSAQAGLSAVLKRAQDAVGAIDEAEAAKEARTQLNQTVRELSGKAAAGYTAQSWNAYEQALQKAQAVLADQNAGKAEILEAMDQLQKAAAALTKAQDSGTVIPPENKPPVAAEPKVGESYTVGKIVYRITSSGSSKNTVTALKPVKKTNKKITIPASVKIQGKTYRVTEISARAFRKNKKLTQVTIGKNVARVGKQAFEGCGNLQKVTVSSKALKSIGKKAFAGMKAKGKIYVPKAKYKAYAKLLKKAKTPKGVSVRKK